MEELTKGDLQFVVSRIPKDVRKLMQTYPALMVGGGFIRSTISRDKVSDIDLFGPDELTLKCAAQEIALKRKGRIHETANALTVLSPPRHPLQFIKRWLFTNMVDLVHSFDFTVCQAVIQCVLLSPETPEEVVKNDDDEPLVHIKWKSYCNKLFYPDLAAKRLTYTCPQRNEDAGGSIMRVKKFLMRGYTIQAESLAKVIARLISKIELKECSDLQREDWMATILLGLLREVDPLAVIDGLEVLDEHDVNLG